MAKLNSIHDVIQLVNLTTLSGFSITCVLLLFVQPTIFGFLGHHIPYQRFPYIVRVLIFLPQAYIMTVACIANCLFLCICILYEYYILVLYSTEFRLNQGTFVYVTNDSLRNNSRNFIRECIAFHVLQQHFILLTGKYLFVANTSFILAIVFTNFVIVRYWKVLNAYILVLFVSGDIIASVVWMLVILLGKLLERNSSRVANSWKLHNWGSDLENRTMKRFQRSCQPLQLSYGKVLIMRKGNLFKFFREITRGTFRLLLTTRK